MRLHNRYIGIIVLLFVILANSSYASNTMFSSDVEAINVAAQSVLMLEVYDSKDELIATGSGFVAFDNYTLITNEHVIEDAEMIIAYSDTGNQYMITKLIAADKKRDIAILEFFSPTDLIPLMLYDHNDIKRAEQIVAIGSPLGLKNAVSLGNISALYQDDGVSLIQFTAPISSGSSGGALFNDKGQVIGITSGSFTEGQNINLAVDIKEIIALYESTSMNDRTKLSKYSTSSAIPIATSTLKPTIKPTIKPTPTLDPEEGFIYFSQSKKFDHSLLSSIFGYNYDKFEKTWHYTAGLDLAKDITWMNLYIAGDTKSLRMPPLILIGRQDTNIFIKSVDFFVENKIYTYKNIRYLKDMDNMSFLYLGSIGRQMIEDMAKVRTISVRLILNDDSKFTYDLGSSQDFSYIPFASWARNISKHKIFDLFSNSDLIYADKVHEALIH